MRINITSYREKYGRVSDWLLRFRKGLFAGMIAISAAAMAFGGSGYQAFAADDSSVKAGSETLAVEEADLSDALQYGGLGTAVNDSEIATLASSYDAAALEERLINAFREYETSIDVQDLGITIDEARNGAISSIISAHPEIISVSGSSYSYYPSTGLVASISISYYANGQAEQQELDNAIKAVDSKIDITGMTDEEIVLAYHEYLTSTVAYAYEPYLQGTLGSKHEYDMYGALINHSSVCQGYAETMFYFLKKAGLSCAVASSKNINHAWNIVKINGKWYHIDATWDDPVWDVPGRSLHKYFLVSFATMNSLTYSSNGKDRSDMVVGAQWGDTYTSATDTSFESGKFWNGIEKAIFYRDGYWYSIGKGSSETIYQITKYRYSTNISQTLYSGTAKWMVSSSSYYPGQYGAIYIQGSTLYFSTPDSLNKIDLTASPISAAEVVNIRSKYSTGYNMYALGEQDGKLVYIVANTPNIGREQDSTDSTKYNKKYDEYEVDICVSHTWDAGVVIKSPTYTSTGKKKYTCTNCGETKTDTIDKLVCTNHKWDDGEVVTPATYKTEGQKKYTCENCGATKTAAIDKLVCTNHKWDDGEVVTPATYKTEGQKKYTCENCGATKTAAIDKLVCTNHKWDDGEVVTPATYKTEGQKKYTCENCGVTKTAAIDKLVCTNHKWDDGEVVTPATYKTEGQKKYTCENCGATKTAAIDKLVCTNHKWDDGEVVTPATYKTEGQKKYTCENCGATKTAAIDKLVCTNHKWDDGEVVTPATYKTEGQKKYTCENCGATKTEEIAKLVCTEHDWDDGVVVIQPTYDTKGTKKYTCKNCGATKTESMDEQTCKEHAWDDGEVVIQPTYKTEGQKKYTCENCEATKTEPIAKLVCTEHDWDDGEVVIQPTYKTEGQKKYTCENCGATKTEPIAKLVCTEHDWDDGEVVIQPTYKTEGQKKYTCENCGATKTEIIEKLVCTAHVWDTGVVTKEPTYTSTGTKEYTCTNCGETKTETIDKLECAEHVWDDGVVVIQSTYDTEGTKEYTCENCGTTKAETIEKLVCTAHVWDAGTVTKASTYTTTGTKKYTCTNCGATKTEMITKLVCTSHKWDAGVVTRKTSYTQAGVKKYTCKNCGTTKQQSISKLVLSATGARTAVTANGVRLAWNRVSAADGYKIYRKASNGSYKLIRTVAGSKTVTVTDTAVRSGVTYSYRICAYKGTAYGKKSEAKQLYIGRTRTKACNVATGVKLSWNKVAGAAGYRIYRKTGNSAYVCIRTVKSSTVAYVDKTVKSGNRYSYFVQPYKSSTKGTCIKAGTLYMARPVVKGKASGRNIRISWTMVKGARQYKIYKKTGKGAYKPVKTVNNPGTLSWTDTNAAKGYTYYNVQAVSGSFKGAASAAVRIKR